MGYGNFTIPSGRTLNAGGGGKGGNWDYAMPSGHALNAGGGGGDGI